MSLAGPFSIGQTLRLGNHVGSDRTAITDEDGVETTPNSAVLTVTTPTASGLRASGTYGFPGAGTLGTLSLEAVGRLYVDVLPAAGEAGRWGCKLECEIPTVADSWEFVVEADPT